MLLSQCIHNFAEVRICVLAGKSTRKTEGQTTSKVVSFRLYKHYSGILVISNAPSLSVRGFSLFSCVEFRFNNILTAV